MTQTIESKGKRLLPTRHFFLDRLWVWVTGLIFWGVGALVLAIATPFWATVVAIWQAPTTLATLSTDVAELRTEVAEATGDDRVIRQPRGLSYVTEPVHLGEDVVYNVVIERTTLGAKCNFMGGQSLFTEAGGVMTPGSSLPATNPSAGSAADAAASAPDTAGESAAGSDRVVCGAGIRVRRQAGL